MINSLKEKLIVQAMQMAALPCRTEIVRISGRSPSTVANVVHGLIQRGLVSELATVSSPSGHRNNRLLISRSMGLVVGISFDWNHISACITDLNGKIVGPTYYVDTHSPDREDTFCRVIKLIEAVCRNSYVDSEELIATGIVLSNRIKEWSGGLEPRSVCDDLSSWPNRKVREVLEVKLGIPCLVASRARSLGTLYYMRRGQDDLFPYVYTDLDFSVGAAIYTNSDEVFSSRNCEVGLAHLKVGRREEQCYCGNRGCLETVASGSAILKLAKEKARIKLDSGTPDWNQLKAGALHGEAWAIRVLADASSGLATALTKMIRITDPKAIIFGGTISRDCLEFLLPEIKTKLKQIRYRSVDELQLLADPYHEGDAALGVAKLAGLAAVKGGFDKLLRRSAALSIRRTKIRMRLEPNNRLSNLSTSKSESLQVINPQKTFETTAAANSLAKVCPMDESINND